jgi:hypothetical protein
MADGPSKKGSQREIRKAERFPLASDLGLRELRRVDSLAGRPGV